MIFASDNWAGAHPDIAASLAAHAGGFASAYGSSDLDNRVRDRFSQLFEREVAVFFVSTGTAANALALTLAGKPGGIAFCHSEAHVVADECGATEYLSGGNRLYPVDGDLGRMDPVTLDIAIGKFEPEFLHAGRPTAVTLTQATEIGTVYSLESIEAVCSVAKRRDLAVHMDGARFANALVSLDTTPAEMTWKRGVDMVSFGATKNGCWCAEAIVLFDPELAREMAFLHKRAAQLFSKSRFIAAQFDAYLTADLWMRLARHSNAMAARLSEHIRNSGMLRLAWNPQANEVFALMRDDALLKLQEHGVVFHQWHPPKGYENQMEEGEILARFVTSFATTQEQVDALGSLIA